MLNNCLININTIYIINNYKIAYNERLNWVF